MAIAPQHREGRLATRPAPAATSASPRAGVSPLGLDRGRDALVHVPATSPGDRPPPLLVLLHGAGSSGAVMLSRLIEATPDPEAVILAPDSRGSTWDVILGGYGPDVEFIDRALEHVFARVEVDAQRVVLAGFSDGASYVLSLGPGNGDLFTRLVAFSPGFMAPPMRIGRPPICVSHGVRDCVLPIDRCSRRLVPRLRSQGYEVRYEEFDGGHDVPAALAREALSWAMTT